MIHPAGMTSPNAFSFTDAKTRLLPRLLQAAKNRIWYCRELRVYRYPLDHTPPLPPPAIFRRNCLDDLKHYERSSKEQQPPDAYRTMAVERRAQGFHLYTFFEGHLHLHYTFLH